MLAKCKECRGSGKTYCSKHGNACFEPCCPLNGCDNACKNCEGTGIICLYSPP